MTVFQILAVAEFAGDADEAPALGAKLDKLIHRFLIFHNENLSLAIATRTETERRSPRFLANNGFARMDS